MAKRRGLTKVERKLGKRLASRGWEPIPGVLIRYWHKIESETDDGKTLRLNPRDVLLLQYLLMNRRKRIGVRDMSYVLNINDRNVRKIISKLKAMGLITCDESIGKKKAYGIQGLISHLEYLSPLYSPSKKKG